MELQWHTKEGRDISNDRRGATIGTGTAGDYVEQRRKFQNSLLQGNNKDRTFQLEDPLRNNAFIT